MRSWSIWSRTQPDNHRPWRHLRHASHRVQFSCGWISFLWIILRKFLLFWSFWNLWSIHPDPRTMTRTVTETGFWTYCWKELETLFPLWSIFFLRNSGILLIYCLTVWPNEVGTVCGPGQNQTQRSSLFCTNEKKSNYVEKLFKQTQTEAPVNILDPQTEPEPGLVHHVKGPLGPRRIQDRVFLLGSSVYNENEVWVCGFINSLLKIRGEKKESAAVWRWRLHLPLPHGSVL